VLGIRPEDCEDAAFAREAPPERTLDSVCSLREALGSEVLVHFPVAPTAAGGDVVEPVTDASATFIARVHPQTTAREGEPLRLVVNTKRLHFFDPESGLAI
jgi:multiple sugar transport system ATP-binding protein